MLETNTRLVHSGRRLRLCALAALTLRQRLHLSEHEKSQCPGRVCVVNGCYRWTQCIGITQSTIFYCGILPPPPPQTCVTAGTSLISSLCLVKNNARRSTLFYSIRYLIYFMVTHCCSCSYILPFSIDRSPYEFNFCTKNLNIMKWYESSVLPLEKFD